MTRELAIEEIIDEGNPSQLDIFAWAMRVERVSSDTTREVLSQYQYGEDDIEETEEIVLIQNYLAEVMYDLISV